MQQHINEKIEQFFRDYEKRFRDGLAGNVDTASITSAFADCFIEASPLGVHCGKNDAAFREAIPKGYDFYKGIGTTKMTIGHVTITALDDLHYMALVHWQSYYTKKDQTEVTIEFDVTYFLQHRNEELKIFAYITGDEQKVLQERGLVS
ncbi:hypothetical protein F0L74_05240 [Chitinophaga agrisoli]|uniref:SnoaL-like protein n=1 Tax=Chitinophaga agrisoli TaxID=2607653 RepID=A0A5B2W568_9BACT|nr:hypothetical protein [Chitinophaga agrisoli]KAA2245369.1 hypothetical protein F0L74_05240 [Chitinophaga agrisoli]